MLGYVMSFIGISGDEVNSVYHVTDCIQRMEGTVFTYMFLSGGEGG